MRELKIEGKVINDQSDAFVIAELGHNHQGNIKKALDMIRAAKECGCDAVKVQKRNNKKLFTAALYNSPYENENSFGKTYGEHREVLEFGSIEYQEMQGLAKEVGITFFATPFDFDSVDFLAKLDIPCFKIASGDLKNIPLLKYIAAFKKPMLISTGGGFLDDVKRVYDSVMPVNEEICLMQCTAAYPVRDFSELNLNVIKTYQEDFNCLIGLSSHDVGISMPIVAYVLGARVIEKHFTLNRTWKGTDQAFSLEPTGMKRMVRDLKRTKEALGDGIKRPYESEIKPLVKMGKGIYFSRDMKVGEFIKKGDLDLKSPMNGIPAYYRPYFYGLMVGMDVKVDDSVTKAASTPYIKEFDIV